MDPICSSCQMTPDNWRPSAYGKSVTEAQADRIYASDSESKDITIFTDEGDKVTISYDHQSEASYANLKALSYGGASSTTDNIKVTKEMLARIKAEQFSFKDSKDLTISVDGDVNDQELADIKKAINQIDEIMTDLVHGGDMSGAATGIEEIRNLESLSGLEADYRYRKELTVEHLAAKEVTTFSRFRPSVRVAHGKHGKRQDGLDKLIDRLAKLIENSNVKPSKFLIPLKKLFVEISRILKENDPVHKTKMQNVDRIESALVKRIEQMSVTQESEASLVIA